MILIDPFKCTGCGVCTAVCPHGVLAMKNKKAFVDHKEDCIECGACQLNCSTGAARVKKGTGCLMLIIKQDILGIKDDKGCSC